MSNNLFTAICFLFMGAVYILSVVLGYSDPSTTIFIAASIIDVMIAVFFFIRYRKEKNEGEDKGDI